MFLPDNGPPAMPLPLSFRDAVGQAMQGYAFEVAPPLTQTVDEPFTAPSMALADYTMPVLDDVALQAPAEPDYGAVAFGLLLIVTGAVALGLAS